jgi:hypothetical protein
MGGSASPFRINIDGISGTNHAKIELEGKKTIGSSSSESDWID